MHQLNSVVGGKTFFPRNWKSQHRASRVTRLGDFSPIGRLFTLTSFLEMTEVRKGVGPFFPRCELRNSFFDGYSLGVFFTNTSGHLLPSRRLKCCFCTLVHICALWSFEWASDRVTSCVCENITPQCTNPFLCIKFKPNYFGSNFQNTT
jgi:hypothetical protein